MTYLGQMTAAAMTLQKEPCSSTVKRYVVLPAYCHSHHPQSTTTTLSTCCTLSRDEFHPLLSRSALSPRFGIFCSCGSVKSPCKTCTSHSGERKRSRELKSRLSVLRSPVRCFSSLGSGTHPNNTAFHFTVETAMIAQWLQYLQNPTLIGSSCYW